MKTTFTTRFLKILLISSLLCLSGCMLLVGRGLRQGYDEVQAIEAINQLADKHDYVDYKQVFPDTYRFAVQKDSLYNTMIRILKNNDQVIMEQNKTKGLIYTAAKEAPSVFTDNDSKDTSKIFYQLSIYLTQKNSEFTYLTIYPTVLKGDFQEVTIPLARNLLRGIYFGVVAGELYPNLKREGMYIAKKRAAASKNKQATSTKEGDTIHEVKPGETLGDIAKQYTGNVMDYKKIAEYNEIADPTKIRVGQKIIIPEKF